MVLHVLHENCLALWFLLPQGQIAIQKVGVAPQLLFDFFPVFLEG